jgi:DNA-binding winged helix-turn-helix (wHTH) protein
MRQAEGDPGMSGDSEYRFGGFELLTRRQVLTHGGARVRVGSRATAILTVLVEGEGDLIAKEKLVAAAWPNTFVDDSNLKVHVSKLRGTLRRYDASQEYIATVPGRGYRFIAPVDRIRTEADGLTSKIPLIVWADDLAAIRERLIENSVVTIAGSDGTWKRALAAGAALAVAAHYPDDVTFDLARISAAPFTPAALALVLGLMAGGELGPPANEPGCSIMPARRYRADPA